MLQTVLKVGNSLAVTLPVDFVKKKKIIAGKKVFVEADTHLNEIRVNLKRRTKYESYTPEFKKWLDDVSAKYSDVIQELAEK